jgi:hypothetical protein
VLERFQNVSCCFCALCENVWRKIALQNFRCRVRRAVPPDPIRESSTVNGVPCAWPKCFLLRFISSSVILFGSKMCCKVSGSSPGIMIEDSEPPLLFPRAHCSVLKLLLDASALMMRCIILLASLLFAAASAVARSSRCIRRSSGACLAACLRLFCAWRMFVLRTDVGGHVVGTDGRSIIGKRRSLSWWNSFLVRRSFS